jgi:hypothetical protein
VGSVINRTRLLADLQTQVAKVEADLHTQIGTLPEVEQRLRQEHKAAFDVKRTAASRTEWIGERVTQVAVAWVLATVFVRFCEDNLLITNPYLSGPERPRQSHAEELHEQFMVEDAARTHRHWLLEAFADLGSGQAGKLLFDPRHNPLYQIPISHDAAKDLIDFWRLREESEDGSSRLVHDFRDPDWDTRFLGDLYQDLSLEAQEKYALLQTPEFVEEFVLDRTLKPAIGEFGYDVVKMIDPTCGSGHFVLGAFCRILGAWEEKAPSADVHTRVRAALDAVHGVDINPFAVAIARFRLLIAALKAAGIKRLRDAAHYEWPLHIATGDALLKSHQLEIFTLPDAGAQNDPASFAYTTEDLADHLNILRKGRYHVVVGNPPYITVKDRNLNGVYRGLYQKTCSGKYALSVPFAQRFFELAVQDEQDNKHSGYVGQITSNSFMKREFGEKLIQHYLASEVDLTEVIDTSGAYIPGHGTPTVILVGRNRQAKFGATTVRAVRGVQGEPSIPEDPAQGLVWRDIVKRIDTPGKSTGTWVSADNLERKRYFSKHPWVLADGGLETVEAIEAKATAPLKHASAQIGFAAITAEDEAFYLPITGCIQRLQIERHRDVITGNVARDYRATPEITSVWPYGEDLKAAPLEELPQTFKIMWPNRRALQRRKRFGKIIENISSIKWHEYGELYRNKLRTALTIAFGEVATHNHFVLDRGDKVFNRTAPVIKLPENATEEDHLRVLGALNSSTACFWLKQMCQDKPSNGVNRSQESEKWTVPYQFNSTNIEEFPLPSTYPIARATELDALAQQLAAVSPAAVAADPEKPPTADALAEARSEWHRIRARMIAVQEELDWEVYGIYGLHEDLTAPVDALPSPGLALGQRAFEIDLARKVEAGEAETEWFRRHNSTPITDFPSDWPTAYKETIQRRLEAIRNSAVIGLVERPEYKRRWLTDGWDSQQQDALRGWLLARMERRELWYEVDDTGTERPRTRTINGLIDDLTADTAFTEAAALYAPGRELADVVPELFSDQHVPFLAPLRYKPAALKNKRAVWEQVWDMQRAEDAAEDPKKALEIRDSIPVPPKYTTADFVKPSYAAQRGGLDVPKERFISYSRAFIPPIEVLGWGGWNHEEQAFALVMAIEARIEASWEPKDLTPYVAGLLEVMPWVRQWHGEHDDKYPGFDSPADFFGETLSGYQNAFGLSDEDLRAWRPEPARRGGGGGGRKRKAEPKSKESKKKDDTGAGAAEKV